MGCINTCSFWHCIKDSGASDQVVKTKIKHQVISNPGDVHHVSQKLSFKHKGTSASLDNCNSNLQNRLQPPSISSEAEYENNLSHLGRIFSSSQLQLLCELATCNVDAAEHRQNGMFCRRKERTPEQLPQLPEGGGVRVVCWNVQRLTKAKALNPGVREVFCRTLLEHRFHLVALQEVADPEAVLMLINELNSPQLPALKRWPMNLRGSWHCSVSKSPSGRQFQAPEFGAFIWNSDVGGCGQLRLELKSSASLKSADVFTRQPFLGHFKMSNNASLTWDILLVSIHLKAKPFSTAEENGLKSCYRTANEASALVCLVSAVMQLDNSARRSLLLLGDFNLPPDHPAFLDLRANGLRPLLSENFPTNSAGTRATDNIWASALAQVYYDGSGVISEGLSHPFIPTADFGWGAPISDHCPIWCQLRCLAVY